MITLRIANITRNSILATHANLAATPEARRIGLIGTSAQEFGPGSGLFFPECNAVHTMEVGFPIDVVFIDMLKRRVVKLATVPQGSHFNTLIPREICSTLELPPGTIELTGTKAGDVIALMSSAHCSQDELNQIGAW